MDHICKDASSRPLAFILAAALLASATLSGGMARADAAFDYRVEKTLTSCKNLSMSCDAETEHAAGILVFPAITKASLILGAENGRGALIQDGKIIDYYTIGGPSIGIQLGAETGSRVYVFHSPGALAKLLNSGEDWNPGTTFGLTFLTDDATVGSATGNVSAYVFDSEGLQGGLSFDAMHIRKVGLQEPTQPSPSTEPPSSLPGEPDPARNQ